MSTLDKLLEMLSAPDPAVRDDTAYRELVALIRSGELDADLVPLGETLVARFSHPEIQARTFAPLVLAAVVERDRVADPVLRRWLGAFAAWWPAEPDIRGWDGDLGWLHAVAHGADLAGVLGARVDGAAVLGLIARRCTAPTAYQFAQQEEDRLARAVVRVLAGAGLGLVDTVAWLSEVDELFATGAPGPLPIPVANTLAMLRATYVMVARSDVPHRDAVTDGIAIRLHEAFPAYPAMTAGVAQLLSSTRSGSVVPER